MNQFTGIGVFVDAYPNVEKNLDRTFPYVSVMLGNGTLSYDHDYDGRPTELRGCTATARNALHDTFLLLRYSKSRLTGPFNVGPQTRSRLLLPPFTPLTHLLDPTRPFFHPYAPLTRKLDLVCFLIHSVTRLPHLLGPTHPFIRSVTRLPHLLGPTHPFIRSVTRLPHLLGPTHPFIRSVTRLPHLLGPTHPFIRSVTRLPHLLGPTHPFIRSVTRLPHLLGPTHPFIRSVTRLPHLLGPTRVFIYPISPSLHQLDPAFPPLTHCTLLDLTCPRFTSLLDPNCPLLSFLPTLAVTSRGLLWTCPAQMSLSATPVTFRAVRVDKHHIVKPIHS
uniref:L-type lectin-like domain-containing protein n=1 Tax=Gasterosteus aculeatus aculeatus TaxID=481459 RepID=A0AAQ4Q5D4_GASAC